jgi:hypothetical protein
MSADKHRGIRRQKQKRAKDLKKQGKQQQSASARPIPPAPQKAA